MDKPAGRIHQAVYPLISIQRESVELSERDSERTRPSITPRGESLDTRDDI